MVTTCPDVTVGIHSGTPRAATLRTVGGRRDDDARRRGAPADESGGGYPLTLAIGFVLAVVATIAIFLTDNPQYLRLAVIAAAWGFVLAAVAVGRRRADRVAAVAREAELRRSFERELDRETAAHREYELELENELRDEAQQWMRREMNGLRQEVAALATQQGDPAGLSVLREQLASLPAVREELARISALRSEIAVLSSLRADVESLTAMRAELGQLAELRADVGRLREELAQQLSHELLIERIIMRTQGVRGPAEPAGAVPGERTADGLTWEETPPRELTGGWPAVQLDQTPGTQEYERVRVDRPAAPLERAPATSAIPGLAEPSWRSVTSLPIEEPVGGHRPPETVETPFAHGWNAGAADRTEASTPTPLDWLAERSLIDPADLPPTRSLDTAGAERHPEVAPSTADVDAIGVERPKPQPFPRHDLGYEPADARRPEPAAYRPPVPDRPPAPPAPQPPRSTNPETETGPVWVSDILAANGGAPRAGGRRRRRYRDEGTEDDVLSRVLGRP